MEAINIIRWKKAKKQNSKTKPSSNSPESEKIKPSSNSPRGGKEKPSSNSPRGEKKSPPLTPPEGGGPQNPYLGFAVSDLGTGLEEDSLFPSLGRG
jgi:hypothetical protein